MKRMTLLASIAVAMTGCATSQNTPLLREARVDMYGSTLAQARHAKADFQGGASKMLGEYSIPDPAAHISDSLARSMREALKMTLVQAEGEAEVLLDVKTVAWGFNRLPNDHSQYRPMYTIRMRLIDTKTGAVLAEAACTPAEKDANPATYDQMLANGAAWLKQAYSAAAARCTDFFRRETLTLG